MKKILTAIIILLLGAATLPAQKIMEGTVTYAYELKGPDGADLGAQAGMIQGMMPNKMVTTYAKQGIITQTEGGMMGGMMGSIVINNDKREMYILQESQKVAYVMGKEELDKSAEVNPVKSTEKLGETMEILGHTCQKYKMLVSQNGKEMEQYIWVATDLTLPAYDVPGLSNLNTGIMGAGSIPGLPLRTEISLPIPGMEVHMTMMATEIKFETVDPQRFERPADYTVKDFSELTRSLMPPGGN